MAKRSEKSYGVHCWKNYDLLQYYAHENNFSTSNENDKDLLTWYRLWGELFKPKMAGR